MKKLNKHKYIKNYIFNVIGKHIQMDYCGRKAYDYRHLNAWEFACKYYM